MLELFKILIVANIVAFISWNDYIIVIATWNLEACLRVKAEISVAFCAIEPFDVIEEGAIARYSHRLLCTVNN